MKLVLAVLLAAAVFNPFPNGSAARYHVDFTRIYGTPAAQQADYRSLERDLDRMEAMGVGISADGRHLLDALQLNDAIQARAGRQDVYLYVRAAVDTRGDKDRDADRAMWSEVAAKTGVLRSGIMRVPDEKLANFYAAEPELRTYAYAIESIRRWTPHTLPDPEEKLLAITEPIALNWQADLYDKLLDEKADRDLFAFTLNRLASGRTDFARLRHFDSAADAAYFPAELTRRRVDALLARVAANADLFKQYEKLRSGSPSEPDAPRFTIDDARTTLLAAAASLGGDYTGELAALLDPANGRLDIVPGPNRKSGGFSDGAIGTDSVFYSAGFAGRYNDLRTLMHESTHAVQRQLMTAGHVRPVYSTGPHFLAEALAMVNELALADFMAGHATDPAQKKFYLEQFLDGKGMIAFKVAPEAELEEAVYDGVNAGTIHSAGDLDALTMRVYSRYSIAPAKDRWMHVRLMYEDPFYDFNYVIGGVIALKLYAMERADPVDFAKRYVGLMRNGYNAPAEALLKKFFGIDLDDPKVLDDGVSLLKDRVAELGRL
jgi:oligoendopeptidase F